MPSPALQAALRWLCQTADQTLLKLAQGNLAPLTASDDLQADMRLIAAELARDDAQRVDARMIHADMQRADTIQDSFHILWAALRTAYEAGRVEAQSGAKCACQASQDVQQSPEAPSHEIPAVDSRASIVGQRGEKGAPHDARPEVGA